MSRSRDIEVGGVIVAQSPNPPLWLAIVGLVLSLIFSDGSTAWGLAKAAFYIGLSVWAWLELTEGVNGFRRGLGGVGVLVVLIGLADQIS